MAGLIGSLAMLLEWSGLGATVDLAALPRPSGVAVDAWLTCFPAYAFLLCCPPGRDRECVAAFHSRELAAAVVGVDRRLGGSGRAIAGPACGRPRLVGDRGYRSREVIPPASSAMTAVPSCGVGREMVIGWCDRPT